MNPEKYFPVYDLYPQEHEFQADFTLPVGRIYLLWKLFAKTQILVREVVAHTTIVSLVKILKKVHSQSSGIRFSLKSEAFLKRSRSDDATNHHSKDKRSVIDI